MQSRTLKSSRGKLREGNPLDIHSEVAEVSPLRSDFPSTKSHAQSSLDLHFASQDDSVSLNRKLLQAPIRTKTR
jgi:hypothetical protein